MTEEQRKERLRKERLELWVEALESGRYKQAQDSLRVLLSPRHYAYCALGVACLVYQSHTGHRLTAEQWAFGELDAPIAEWYGTRDYNLIRAPDCEADTVISANDSAKMPFRQIAEGIRRYHGLDKIEKGMWKEPVRRLQKRRPAHV